LLEDEENPPEEGLTALGLLEDDENPLEEGLLLGVEERDEEKPLDDEERDEEKPLDDEERDEENPLPLASIAGSKIIDSPRIRYLIYCFIGFLFCYFFVKEFNIQGVFLLSRPFCNFS
jgi:hypothetical protein